MAFGTASPYVWEYRGVPKRFSFRVAYQGRGKHAEGVWSNEISLSTGG
ncbi:MAG: hypothetical protein NZ550_01295 [Fimbriimonadales bacterium]|nr:hypothetical protein [Fimbriimonadales bacterium]MDW8051448.1 hypothetical protein [Armatimonadota bacterium]